MCKHALLGSFCSWRMDQCHLRCSHRKRSNFSTRANVPHLGFTLCKEKRSNLSTTANVDHWDLKAKNTVEDKFSCGFLSLFRLITICPSRNFYLSCEQVLIFCLCFSSFLRVFPLDSVWKWGLFGSVGASDWGSNCPVFPVEILLFSGNWKSSSCKSES